MKKIITTLTILFLFAACKEGEVSPSSISIANPPKSIIWPGKPFLSGTWTNTQTWTENLGNYSGIDQEWEITSDSIFITRKEYINYYNYTPTSQSIAKFGYTYSVDSIRATYNGNTVFHKPYQKQGNKLTIQFIPFEDFILIK